MLAPEEVEKIRVEFGEALQTYLVKGDGSGEPAVLPDGNVTALEKMIDGFIGHEELMPVVEATLVISHVLETRENSPTAAKRLADIVGRQTILDGMQAVIDGKLEEASEGTAKTALKFSKFSDRPQEKGVADPDAEKPDNSIQLNDIDFPKRL